MASTKRQTNLSNVSMKEQEIEMQKWKSEKSGLEVSAPGAGCLNLIVAMLDDISRKKGAAPAQIALATILSFPLVPFRVRSLGFQKQR